MKCASPSTQSIASNEHLPPVTTCALVPTELGWFGIVWHGECVSHVTFGHASQPFAESDLAAVTDVSPTRVESLHALHQDLVDRIVDYALGASTDFMDVALSFDRVTPFQAKVLRACRRIPWGQTRSYGDLASEVGSPKAARAVGTVMANNRHPILIPCHRVVAASQRIGGFSSPGGTRMKKRLLAMESAALAPRLGPYRPPLTPSVAHQPTRQ